MADDPTAALAERWRQLYIRMKNVAAGYSNMCADEVITKTLDKEYMACEAVAHVIGTEDDYPTRVNDASSMTQSYDEHKRD